MKCTNAQQSRTTLETETKASNIKKHSSKTKPKRLKQPELVQS